MFKKLSLTVLALIASAAMHAEQTLAIIKPDAVKAHHIGEIITRFEKNGLDVEQLKMTRLTPEQAQQFYIEHKGKPFYNSLVDYMTSGPIVVMVLDGNNAISKNRVLMGATDPSKANKGSLRAEFGTSIEKNAVHGSDSKESAAREINFFFGS